MPVGLRRRPLRPRGDDAQAQPDSRRVVPAAATRATRTDADTPPSRGDPGQPSIAVAVALLDERREFTAEHVRLHRE
jgi:hypothetical protein